MICSRAASRHKSQRNMFRLRDFGTGKHSVTEKKAPRAARVFVQDVQNRMARRTSACASHINFFEGQRVVDVRVARRKNPDSQNFFQRVLQSGYCALYLCRARYKNQREDSFSPTIPLSTTTNQQQSLTTKPKGDHNYDYQVQSIEKHVKFE